MPFHLVFLSLLSILQKISRLGCNTIHAFVYHVNGSGYRKNKYLRILMHYYYSSERPSLGFDYRDPVIRLVSVTWLSSAQRTLETFPTPAIGFEYVISHSSPIVFMHKEMAGISGQ